MDLDIFTENVEYFMNIYIKYYNSKYNKKSHLFHGIDTDDQTSTNHIMESLAKEIQEHKKCSDPQVYDHKKYDDGYVLESDGKFFSKSLISLMNKICIEKKLYGKWYINSIIT